MRRKNSIRLQGYDYSSAGLYFLTLCTQNRLMLFGEIKNQTMLCNAAGNMVEKWYAELENKFPNIQCHDMIVMPNHMHCIIQILDTNDGTGDHAGTPQQQYGIPQIMEWFKTMTTNAYIRGVKQHNWQRFENKIWQRSYHDHIIRNAKSYDNISNYIQTNAERWDEDMYL